MIKEHAPHKVEQVIVGSITLAQLLRRAAEAGDPLARFLWPSPKRPAR
jgi:hypothetical protein